MTRGLKAFVKFYRNMRWYSIIKNHQEKKRAEKEFDKFVKSKSLQHSLCRNYLREVDRSKLVDGAIIDDIVKRFVAKCYNDPEYVYARFVEICAMEDTLQKQAFHELDMLYSKGHINPNALVHINEERELIYSLIMHKDMCYWVENKCPNCQSLMIKMIYKSPMFAWWEHYGTLCSLFICPKCLTIKHAGGGFMIS